MALLFHCNKTTIYHTLKRFGLRPPPQWARNAAAAFEAAGTRVPEVIIEKGIDRAWAASLFGGEGCIAADYSERDDATFLVTMLRMSDKD